MDSIEIGDGNLAVVGSLVTHKLWAGGSIVFEVTHVDSENGVLICRGDGYDGMDFTPAYCSLHTPTSASTSAKSEFRKTYKAGKPKMHLLHWRGIEEVAYVREWGNEKHGGDNMHLTEKEDLLDAIVRHTACMYMGNTLDAESGRHHGAHIATNALYLVERYKLEEETK